MALRARITSEPDMLAPLPWDDIADYAIPEGVDVGSYRAYLTDPSPANAKKLLKHLGKTIPTSVAQTPRTTMPAKRTRSQRGGDADVFQALALSDMLHDLLPMSNSPSWPSIRDWFLERTKPFVTKRDVPTDVFNDKMARAWTRAFGQSHSQVFHTAIYEKTHEDDVLYHALQEWAKMPNLSIVIDGILGRQFEMILETAILLLVVQGGAKVQKPRLRVSRRISTNVRQVSIFDGFFQNIDDVRTAIHPPQDGFLQRYANHLAKAFGNTVVTIYEYVSPLPPRYLPGYSVQMGDRGPLVVLPDGSSIEYRPNDAWRYGMKKQRALAAGIHLPYGKATLETMVADMFADGGTPTEEESGLLLRAAMLNFFRDAYKADIALQHHALLWTHDRLAFTFYALMRRRHNIGAPGLFVQATDKLLQPYNEIVVELP